MTETQLQTKVWDKDGWTVWSISGSLNRQNFLDADEEGDKYLENSEKFAVDMAELTYISSAGFRVMMRLAKNADAMKKKFVIVSALGMVKTVLKEARIDLFIPMLGSLDELD